MAKRFPKSVPPESVSTLRERRTFPFFCEVYVPLSPQVFTYGVAENSGIMRGSVVWVQLAKRKPMLGLVAKVISEVPSFNVKEAVPHASHYVFDERYMEILEWTAKYYLATPMQALSVFLPRDFGKYLDALVANMEIPEKPVEVIASPEFTGEQKVAYAKLAELLEQEGFRGTLLHGVTGSGKTRVYMELAKLALSEGKRVLVLVPEIGLAPQTAERFSAFLGFDVPVLHSALSAPKKRLAWLSILSKKAKIVLGTRSAILTPFAFDLVIIDEEHDSSYKQEDSPPRYHAREVAFHAAYKYGALVVLGSATPSLETFYAANSGNLSYLTLSRRATETSLPAVHLVDMHKKARLQQAGLLLSAELREALTRTVANGYQAIILMNRRGYSKSRVCAECGSTFYCKACKIPLVYHKQYGGLLCHYCGRLYPLNMPCPECGSSEYEFVGGAIEKLEEEISEWVPEAKVVRMDRDTTQNVGAAEKILSDFRDCKYSVLLGTQIVAKGHDFPGVQLVGVVGADSGSGVPDFRAGERLFQLLSQTSGRAGRAKEGGEVFLQTNKPDDPIIRFAIHHDYAGFAKEELLSRNEAMYPPYCKVASIELGSKDENMLHTKANAFGEELSKKAGLQVLGPVDSYIPQVKNVFWMNLLIKAPSAAVIRQALAKLPQDLDVRVNIDPL
ncbi:MAG: primosomal protein N' [Fibrobacteraceae bacterium]|nr:primosomal protein N' [Fibrobacteraceae bacterium]